MGHPGGGDREGASSSGTRKQQPPRDGDYETALRLQKMLDEEAEYPDHRRHNQKEIPIGSRNPGKAAYSNKASSRDPAAPHPKDIQNTLHAVQKFISEVMETACRKCDSALMGDFNVHRWFRQWTSTKGQPQPSSICSLTCPKKECQALPCLGCGEKPRMGKFNGKIDGFRLDWCCESGRLFALWIFLCEFDNLELAEQKRSRDQVQLSSKRSVNASSSSDRKGTGYGSGFEYMPYSYKITPTESLHFK